MKWVRVTDELPPRGVMVPTKVEDAEGVRNQQDLAFGLYGTGLWWSSAELYVYYRPSHWRK